MGSVIIFFLFPRLGNLDRDSSSTYRRQVRARAGQKGQDKTRQGTRSRSVTTHFSVVLTCVLDTAQERLYTHHVHTYTSKRHSCLFPPPLPLPPWMSPEAPRQSTRYPRIVPSWSGLKSSSRRRRRPKEGIRNTDQRSSHLTTFVNKHQPHVLACPRHGHGRRPSEENTLKYPRVDPPVRSHRAARAPRLISKKEGYVRTHTSYHAKRQHVCVFFSTTTIPTDTTFDQHQKTPTTH